MRIILASLFITSIAYGGNPEIDVPSSAVQILSKTKTERISEGFFQMNGEITNAAGDSTLQHVVITNQDQSVSVMTNEKGLFRIQFSVEDSVVYFFKPGFGETSIPLVGDRNQFHYEVAVRLPNPEVYMVMKPVIYLYSFDNCHLNIVPKGEFTFTYPLLEDGWNVSANDNGVIINQSDGKEYPYLFWESEMSDLTFLAENEEAYNHYDVETKDIVPFLETELTLAGLNEKELTDFITFWGPRIQRYENVEIQFLVDEEYSNVAELNISPKPENSRRIYILFKECTFDDSPVSNVRVDWSELNRSGSTLIEWGGSDLSKTKSL